MRDLRLFQRTGWLLIALFLISWGDLEAQAQIRPGDRVVLRSRDSTLKVGSRVVARGDLHRVFRVEEADGDWRWLVAEDVQGWAKADQLLTLNQAIASYSSQIQAGGNTSYAYAMRGMLRADLGDGTAALADFNEAVRLGPTSASAYLARGGFQYQRGNPKGAFNDFNQVIRLNPRDPLAYYNRALARIELDQFDEAIDDFGRTLRLDPTHTSARFNRAALALLLDRRGASADAESSLSLVGWDDPTSAYLALIGVLSHQRTGNDDQAKTLLNAAKQGLDNEFWPYPIVRYLAGEIDLEALLEASKNPTQQAEARAYAGLTLAQQAKAREAVPLLRWVIEQDASPQIQIPRLLASRELDRLRSAGVPAALETEEEPL